MANIHTVFEAVLDNGASGKQVRVGVIDGAEYETVRTRLVKLWNDHKRILVGIAGEGCDPLLEYSLCGNFDPQELAGFFFLGRPRRKQAKSYSFAIVDAGATPATEEASSTSVSSTAVNDELPTQFPIASPKLA